MNQTTRHCHSAHGPTDVLRLLYSFVLHFSLPWALFRLYWRGRVQPGYSQRWYQRLGFGMPELDHCIWVHAVSVGEVAAAQPIILQLAERFPTLPIVLSTTTATGQEKARQLFAGKVQLIYCPFDLTWAVKRTIKSLNPRLLLIMETELWPNLLYVAQRSGVPILLANARLSDRSRKRYIKTAAFWRPLLKKLQVAARSKRDAEGFLAMGARPDQLTVSGNVKYDFSPAPEPIEEARLWRSTHLHAAERPIWVVSSTHPGEDERLLPVHKALLKRHPDLLLILVPRHPERFQTVADLLIESGMRFGRRSQSQWPRAADQVFLVDSIGELMRYYALADLAFVGGSFVNVGGHNPLEPASLGLPVLTGPMIHNFVDEYASLRQRGGATVVVDDEALQTAIHDWLVDAGARCHAGEQAHSVVADNRGAAAHVAMRVADLVDG